MFHIVIVLPNITTQPVSIAIKAGDLNAIALSCSAIGMSPVYYHWEKYHSTNNSWINPSHRAVNDTSPILKFHVITEEDEGVYHCKVTNDAGSVISDNATVNIYSEFISCVSVCVFVCVCGYHLV